MSNGIDIRQNEEKSIAMLAAQKQLYKDAKNFNYAVIVLSLIFPFLMSVLLVFFQNPSFKMASLIAVIVSIVLNILFGNFIKRKKELAAYIQQKFDVYVYKMPWDKRLFGEEKNVNREIDKYSRSILSDEREKKLLENWYTEPNTKKTILEGILGCQRENDSWDYELRQRARSFGIGAAIMMIILVFAIGVFNQDPKDLLFERVALIIPIVAWLSELVRILDEDIKRLKEVEIKINTGESKSMDELQEIQRDIYLHRKDAYIIPDQLYNLFKKKDEEREKRIAQMQ